MAVIFFPNYHNPDRIKLYPEEVHIWAASINNAGEAIPFLMRTLSTEENEKSKQYYYRREFESFTISRGILRSLIGIYQEIDPSDFRFEYGKHGKPKVNIYGKEQIYFNLAHSEEMVIFAFTRVSQIGIDIEYIRDIPEMDKLAERFFSPAEYRVYKKIPEERRTKPFFNCWTRKEAFIKAVGEGFSRSLQSFEVSFINSEPSKLMNINGDRKTAERWIIGDIKPASGYTAAFALEQRKIRLQCFNWNIGLARNVLQLVNK